MNGSSFPRIYAAHVAQFSEDLPLWRTLATSSGSPILELGCGPGRVVSELANEGFIVTGLDHNQDMIQWARSHTADDLLEKINFIHADMRNFILPDRYALTIIPCNTFAYFSEVDALQVLACVKEHLTFLGKLAMVIPNPEPHTSIPATLPDAATSGSEPITHFIEPISQRPVHVYAEEKLDLENNTLQVLWSFDELFPDGEVIRLQHPITYHLRSLELTIRLLESVDLEVEDVYGDYHYGPLDRNSPEIILLVKKNR